MLTTRKETAMNGNENTEKKDETMNGKGASRCPVCRKIADSGKKVYSATARCIKEIKDDVQAVKERDPAAKSTAEIVLTYSGLHAVLAYRLSHQLYKKGRFTTARVVSQTARFFTGKTV